MSGLVGIVRTDGGPLPPGILAPFMEALAPRGPDAHGTWQDGPAAFGHTLFRTSNDIDAETQPMGINLPHDSSEQRGIWIVADARIDGRDELIQKLAPMSGVNGASLRRAPDVELILHAYIAWGDACVQHLIGDFVFAIWDGPARRLFCARDQMGVKPFYYAAPDNAIVFSNALDCARRHPGVSSELNDLAMADCLLFGSNQDSQTTVYRDVRRLAGGHTMTWSPRSGLQVRRYWSLPIDEPIYYRRPADYVERFNELLHQAVSDRLRTSRASVFMSGGVDSTLLAATAIRQLGGRGDSPVHAYTFVYGSLLKDDEREFAEAAARHMAIPLTLIPMDEHPEWLQPGENPTPEPLDSPRGRGPHLRAYAAMAAHGPVALYGEGPDNALRYEWRPHLAYLARQRRWGRLTGDIVRHIRHHRRVPLLGTIPRMLRERVSPDRWAVDFPDSLQPGLVKRLRLKDRWKEINSLPPSSHPTRPSGHASMASPLWQGLFEAFDTAYTGTLLEVRHPYLDIRVLRYFLSIPAMPWCRRKYLLRAAARPLLPNAVLTRNKTPLTALPDEVQARRHGHPPLYWSPVLGRYTTFERFEESGPRSVTAHPAHFYLAAISHWLKTRSSFA